jgi:hypothetical protein
MTAIDARPTTSCQKIHAAVALIMAAAPATAKMTVSWGLKTLPSCRYRGNIGDGMETQQESR